MEQFEIVVIGGGVAALTAALFAGRNGHSTVLLSGIAIGGQLLSIGNIEDFPGFPEGVPGYELCPRIQEQAMNAGVQFRSSTAVALEPADAQWIISTENEQFSAPAVIVATGSRFKSLNVPGEARLRGKGVSHCATCDAPLLRGTTVAVVGGGDSALVEALELARHVQKVIICHQGQSLDAQHTYQQRVLQHPKIEVRYRTTIEEIAGESAVRAVKVRDNDSGELGEVEVSAVFTYIGLEPQTSFVRDQQLLDDSGRILTDAALRTRRAGLFAAGDVRSGAEAQAIVAAGEGAVAALGAHRYLCDRSWPQLSFRAAGDASQ